MSKKERVLIVGGGMAGLTAAAYLAREDFDITILEKNNQVGGLVSTFERNGYFFDTGPRAFVNSGMVKPIFKDLGIELETIGNKISIAVEDKLVDINSLDSIKEYSNMLKDLYPENIKDIDKISKIIYKLSKHTEVLYEFDNPFFVDYTSDLKVLFTEFIPWLFKLSNSLRNFNKYNKPMVEFLLKYTNNRSLIDIITQYFFRETPTYFALGYFQVYLDYFYPENGTGTLAELLHSRIKDDVKIITNSEVVEIIASENSVKDINNQTFEYDYLIWAADLKRLYEITNTSNLKDKVKNNILLQKEKIEAAKPAESAFIMFLGVDRPLSYFKEASGEHMFYTPSRDGLQDLNGSLRRDIIENFESKSKEEVFDWLGTFLDKNTYEVSIPGLRDQSLVPDGKTGIMISFLFDYEIPQVFEKAGYLTEFKSFIEDRIIQIFSDGIYKDMKDDVEFAFSTNPLGIQKRVGSSGGGIVGWSFETKPPVFNKLKDLAKSVYTPIPNVFKAGQWAYAPAGVPIAMLTGWRAYEQITKLSKKKKK